LEESSYSDGNNNNKTEMRMRDAYNALSASLPTLHDHFTPQEKSRLIDKPLGSWSVVTDLYPVKSRWESLGVLLWTLRIIPEIPAYSTDFDKSLLFQSTAIVPAFPQSILEFIDYFKTLKPGQSSWVAESEFKRAVDVAEAWLWRAKAQRVLDLKVSLQGDDSPHVQEAKKWVFFFMFAKT
jgi:hypothetical protein